MKIKHKKIITIGAILLAITLLLIYFLNPSGLFFQGNLGHISKPTNNTKELSKVQDIKLPAMPSALPQKSLEKVIPNVETAELDAKTHLEIGADGKVHVIDDQTGKEVDTNPYDDNAAAYVPCQKGVVENGRTIWSYCNGVDFETEYTHIYSSTSSFIGEPGEKNYEKFNIIVEKSVVAENTGFFNKLTQNIKDSTSGNDGRKYFQGRAYLANSATPVLVEFTVIPDRFDSVDGTQGFAPALVVGSVREELSWLNYNLDFLNGIRKIEFDLKNNSIIRFENFTGFDFSTSGFPTGIHAQGSGTVTPHVE